MKRHLYGCGVINREPLATWGGANKSQLAKTCASHSDAPSDAWRSRSRGRKRKTEDLGVNKQLSLVQIRPEKAHPGGVGGFASGFTSCCVCSCQESGGCCSLTLNTTWFSGRC